MKSKLDGQKLIFAAVEQIAKRLESTEKFAIEQAPDLAREMIREVYVANAPQALGSAILLLVAIGSGLGLIGSTAGENIRFVSCLCVGVFGGVFGSALFFEAMTHMAHARFCPKLVILEKFSELLKRSV